MLTITRLTLFFPLLLHLTITNAARILVILPTPSHTHNFMYSTIYKKLSLRGHELVVFTSDPIKDPKLTNLIEIDMNYLYKQQPDIPYEKLLTFLQLGALEIIQESQTRLTTQIFSHPEMQKLINNTDEHFDLLLLEWDVNPSLGVLSRRFNCPMVGLKAKQLQLEGHESIGNPTNPSHIPIGWGGDFELTFWGRLKNFVMGITWRAYYHWYVVPGAQKIADQFLGGFSTDVLEVQKNVSLILCNTHPVFTGIRPVVSAFVEVGGVHLKEDVRSIPKDVLKYLNSAKNGVIYVNLGSAMKNTNLDRDFLKIFISGLSELPYRVLWKWDGTQVLTMNDVVASNVKIVSNWLPQEAILGHPKIKAFITHGGLQSIYEATDNAIPMVGIPFYGDQYVNVRQMEKLRIGRKLDFGNLQKKRFVATVKKVAENPVYKKNIKYARELLHDLPIKPLEKAVWWIEYSLRHKGAKHLRSPVVDMDFIAYFLLDVIALLLFCLLVIIWLALYVLRRLRSILTRRNAKEKLN